MIRSSVDLITTRLASGWIYSDSQKDPLAVEALINDQVVGRAVADLQRPDLAEARLGDGKCGFEIQFQNEVDPLFLPFVQVMLAGTDLELRRWAGAGFRDYFRALHLRYPRLGRAASVYGGLWTDRTDAAAVLKGRADIGSIPSRDANSIARYIQDGAVVITRREDKKLLPNTAASRDIPTAVAETMFDEDLLRMVRHVLEDHPVAVRADALEAEDTNFGQMSAVDELPSPAECMGLIFPATEKATAVDVVRGGHRFSEFLPNGLSRWTYEAAATTATQLLSSDLPVDRFAIPRGSALMVSPGALYRVAVAMGRAMRVLVIPSRLSLLRFHKKAPRGELTHASGARIWV
jgi:hypothetical protein